MSWLEQAISLTARFQGYLLYLPAIKLTCIIKETMRERMKTLLKQIKDNLIEIYLGALLFILLPVMVAFYFDWRAGIIASVVLQVSVIILYIARSK